MAIMKHLQPLIRSLVKGYSVYWITAGMLYVVRTIMDNLLCFLSLAYQRSDWPLTRFFTPSSTAPFSIMVSSAAAGFPP